MSNYSLYFLPLHSPFVSCFLIFSLSTFCSLPYLTIQFLLLFTPHISSLSILARSLPSLSPHHSLPAFIHSSQPPSSPPSLPHSPLIPSPAFPSSSALLLFSTSAHSLAQYVFLPLPSLCSCPSKSAFLHTYKCTSFQKLPPSFRAFVHPSRALSLFTEFCGNFPHSCQLNIVLLLPISLSISLFVFKKDLHQLGCSLR